MGSNEEMFAGNWGHKGSKVLATTRSEEVVSAMRSDGCHQLQILSEDQSLALFEKCAFAEGGATRTPELGTIAKRILRKCGGVPLAVKAIGSLLYSKDCESEWLMIERSGMWSLPSGDNGVLSAIKLSYDHLPSWSIKQCFAYCAIFRKGTILEKDKLVQLWMAQGFLNPPKGSHNWQMEDIGDIYFNILLKSSLLQDPQKDEHNNITHCKMHDLLHDVSFQVSENYCIDMKDWKVVSSEVEAVHLSIVNSHEKGLWKTLKGIVPSKLRTLHLEGFHVLEDWFRNFRCLSVLIAECWGAKELPNAVGKITHLRFLDIHQTGIHMLPKSFTELYYLQCLRVNYLYEVPNTFGNLINLRHLYVDDTWLIGTPTYLLPGLGQMTNLQTLPFFKVDKSSQIEELENLDNLKGLLRIFCLQNVGSCESALRSNLSRKTNIQTLELHWDKRKHDCNDTDVVEGLKPYSNLKSLKIVGYQGPKFPSWMVTKNNFMLLRNLVKFSLEGLDKCQQLPSLGDLPYLEYLEIGSLPNVKFIDTEFYGLSNPDRTRKNCCSNVAAEITFFPALRVLKFWDMNSLGEWSDAIIPTHSKAKVFPCLEELEMNGLPNLSSFPNLGSLPHLLRLLLKNCYKLTLSSSWNSLMSHKLEGDERSTMVHSSSGAEGTWSCHNFVTSPNIHYLQSLHQLDIVDCDKFVAPFCNLKILAPLKSLSIVCNPRFWPKNLHNLISLESLYLRGDSTEIDCFPWPYSGTHSGLDIQHSISLTSLVLHGWPEVTSLPDQIQYVTTLKKLVIWNFDGLDTLPEWLGSLEYLKILQIWSCMNLKQIPSAEAFQRLMNLENLVVYNCPLLKERCVEGSGPEWLKIAHIPNIMI